jgi:hypothetical protein
MKDHAYKVFYFSFAVLIIIGIVIFTYEKPEYISEEPEEYSYEVSNDYEEESYESSSPAPGALTDELKWDVYMYMKQQYNVLTNNGANYSPEYHDPLVAKKAAEKYKVTEEEAGQIYVDFEMGNY